MKEGKVSSKKRNSTPKHFKIQFALMIYKSYVLFIFYFPKCQGSGTKTIGYQSSKN